MFPFLFFYSLKCFTILYIKVGAAIGNDVAKQEVIVAIDVLITILFEHNHSFLRGEKEGRENMILL